MEVKSKEIIKALIGFGLLYIGFYLMGSVNLHIGLFQELTLLVFSLLAAALIFKNSALEWFRKPEGKYLKIIILCFFANVIWSFIGGALVTDNLWLSRKSWQRGHWKSSAPTFCTFYVDGRKRTFFDNSSGNFS